MRSKYSCFKEYHNSLDRIGTVVTEKGLRESFKVYKEVIKMFENNFRPKATNLESLLKNMVYLKVKFTRKKSDLSLIYFLIVMVIMI